MSVTIYTYHDPYKIVDEPFWSSISNCPHFCVSQTMVNGLRAVFSNRFEGGRVTVIKALTDSIFEKWVSTSTTVKQYADIDNIFKTLQNNSNTSFEQRNMMRSLSFNRDEVFNSLRTLFELNVNPNNIDKNKLTKEQAFFIEIYEQIISSSIKNDFQIEADLSEKQIDEALNKAMTAIKEDYDCSGVNKDRIVIHGVHRFTPIMLRAIEEIQRYKDVILLFNYQTQYKNIYQTWIDVYSAFDCSIIDFPRNEYVPSDTNAVSYEGNNLADMLGKLANGQKKWIAGSNEIEILEFDNMTEFAGYVANIYKAAVRKNPLAPMSQMSEQIYAADSSVNEILKIYFPEQFGERQFLNYPLGHFFIAIANMWDVDANSIQINDINDVKECLKAGIISEENNGELVTIFNRAQSLFEGCDSLTKMCKRLKRLKKQKQAIGISSDADKINRLSYFRIDPEDIDKLATALDELESLAEYFYEDFEKMPNNFSEFYKKLKAYLKSDAVNENNLSEEFKDILARVLQRLNEVEGINVSASFECLKSTMSIYLCQEPSYEKSANWIVRNFEQIDGDILRSGRGNSNTVYHFACLEDESINSTSKSIFPWPLDDAFFEIAQNPVDWKYQVYVKSSNEYKNFKLYALLFGLEFNRAKFRLSYIKRNGEKVREPYYLLRMLGVKKVPYAVYLTEPEKDDNEIRFDRVYSNKYDAYDCYRYGICKFKFLSESIIENDTIYKDTFLILKYMEVLLENRMREEMQGKPVNFSVVVDKLEECYRDLKKYFPFVENANRLDIINNVRARLTNAKVKTFPVLSEDDRKHMKIKELFIHRKLGDLQNKGFNILHNKFPEISQSQIEKLLNDSTLNETRYHKSVETWCKFCANREICIEYYSRIND